MNAYSSRVEALTTFQQLTELEETACQSGAQSPELKAAIEARSIELGKVYVLDALSRREEDLTPAETDIVRGLAYYVGLKRREKSHAGRTITQVKSKGLKGAAEAAVSQNTSTPGYDALVAQDLVDLSYEKIISNHPNEFSSRSVWFARRKLNTKLRRK
ncbi:hypothetical protein [Hyphomicrobium sp.]|uniref:hypothetical protein n=1 Tax=Hyphomicrobium sp. TaxID=82 RepID=UPI000F96DC4E|nr:hypothetical protein [Hyphomicrobium sp.]MBN9248173.1 hypothetical protein [Hyphomicrobium sp.]RUP07387.1 MAG: hypothetical protein EKK38_19690 [Hyphomicrobium sp.]